MKANPCGKSVYISRREAIRRSLYGAVGMLLAHGLSLPAWAVTELPKAKAKARAKSVIQIWMWGGPPHMDTFDMKPDAGQDYAGPLKPIPTNVDGIQICELLPLLAKQADKYSIIRSMTHGINGHETAAYMVQTGRKPGDGEVYPTAGAVVSLFKGYSAGYKGLIPPYIVMTRLQGRFSESGFLGSRAKPFATGGDPSQTPFVVEGVVAQGITEQRQKNRREFLRKLNTLEQVMKGDEKLAASAQCEQAAYDLILGDAGKVFDLSQEPAEVRDRYGKTKFGQSCLVARRLVERGVPYVTINYEGWDTHKGNFQAMQRKLPEMDKGMASLFQDLAERGLLDSTIVWWGGEFGRTPYAEKNGTGRDHNPGGFTVWLAGGGLRSGFAHGATDEFGHQAVENTVHMHDLHATILHLLGLDHEKLTFKYAGRDFWLTDVHGRVVKELIA
ncbi:MAG: DUF1501 domain-containing protein [Verrucomicrobiae bacterium]|nr:DUF1501 domain-containing protein [Verrucomicrobiae bacterium]